MYTPGCRMPKYEYIHTSDQRYLFSYKQNIILRILSLFPWLACFFFKNFFLCQPFLKSSLIFLHVASLLCFGFLASKNMESWFVDLGLNLRFLHWKVKSYSSNKEFSYSMVFQRRRKNQRHVRWPMTSTALNKNTTPLWQDNFITAKSAHYYCYLLSSRKYRRLICILAGSQNSPTNGLQNIPDYCNITLIPIINLQRKVEASLVSSRTLGLFQCYLIYSYRQQIFTKCFQA